MTTYDKAYCQDLVDKDPEDYKDGYISAKEANQIFIADKNKLPEDRRITENTSFKCGKTCPVNLTCINLKIDFSQDPRPNKISPYFANRKGNHNHSATYPRKIKFIEEHRKNKKKDQIYYFEDNKIIFDFSSSEGLSINLNPTRKAGPDKINNHETSGNRSVNRYNNDGTTSKTKSTRTHHTNRLKEIVELWQNYKEFGLTHELYDKNDHQLDFDYFFKKVQGQKLDHDCHIYYGQAFCQHYGKNGSLILRYSNSAAYLEKICDRPSVIINEKRFADARCKGVFKDLKKYADRWEKDKTSSQSYFELYYLGKFEVKAKVTSKGKEDYISFDYKKPDFPKYIFIEPNPENE